MSTIANCYVTVKTKDGYKIENFFENLEEEYPDCILKGISQTIGLDVEHIDPFSYEVYSSEVFFDIEGKDAPQVYWLNLLLEHLDIEIENILFTMEDCESYCVSNNPELYGKHYYRSNDSDIVEIYGIDYNGYMDNDELVSFAKRVTGKDFVDTVEAIDHLCEYCKNNYEGREPFMVFEVEYCDWEKLVSFEYHNIIAPSL